MDIKKIKKEAIQEIQDFLELLLDYGHIYHYPPENLDSPFEKIIEGMNEVRQLMDDSYGM